MEKTITNVLIGQEPHMSPMFNIAIVIKHPRLFHEARDCALALIDTGAKVMLYYLGAEMSENDQKDQLPLYEQMTRKAECYMDDPQLADRYGLCALPIERLAEKLKEADRVIPF